MMTASDQLHDGVEERAQAVDITDRSASAMATVMSGGDDAVVEPALDVEHAPHPGRDRRVADDLLAEVGIGRRERRADEQGQAQRDPREQAQRQQRAQARW